MKIYITDTTLKPSKDVIFNDYNSTVAYLEGLIKRSDSKTRKEYMILLESIGYGEDDPKSVNFIRSLSERFDIGIVREGKKMRCDITSAYIFDRPEYGN